MQNTEYYNGDYDEKNSKIVHATALFATVMGPKTCRKRSDREPNPGYSLIRRGLCHSTSSGDINPFDFDKSDNYLTTKKIN